MSINFLMTSGQSKHSKDIFGHWLWAVPILLMVAALAIRQIDLYPPTQDEFYSMYNAGWLINSPYSPIEIMQSLQRYSPNHTPGYFLLLNLWGNLTAYDIVLGRIFTIFTGLLSLAIAYRLARDFVAPAAGLLMLIVVSSNAFYNYYITFTRFYPLVVFITGIVLWLYLRIMFRVKSPKALDYLALFAAVFALENIHLFCATFLAALGIYHLLFAPKNRRWIGISITVVTAVAMFLPVLVGMISQIERAIQIKSSKPIDGMTALDAWFTVMLNDQPGLLIAVIVGLLLGFWHKRISAVSYLLLSIIFLLILTLVAEFSGFIRLVEMRYHLVGMLPFALAVTAGLYGLYSLRRWLGLFVLLWLVAGLYFHSGASWLQYIAGRQPWSPPLPPWQVISRLASRADAAPVIVGYRLSRKGLELPTRRNYPQKHYYFDRHHIELKLFDNPEAFDSYVRQHVIALPSVWVVYKPSATMPHEAASLQVTLGNLDYQLCDTLNVAVDTVILQYAWDTLNCQPPQLAASYQTDMIDYQFYGAVLDTADSKLHFNDRWTARRDDALSNYRLSHQLITSDWNNVAQLDLPLVHEGQLRLFSIDISNVPAGTYRLMAILYDKDSGERQDWLNSAQDVSNMLTLTEIIIPVK